MKTINHIIIFLFSVAFLLSCQPSPESKGRELAEQMNENNKSFLTDRNELEALYSQLTQEQLANRKRSAEDGLEKLRLQLESDSLNPEERHEAMLTISNIKQELELIDKYLHN